MGLNYLPSTSGRKKCIHLTTIQINYSTSYLTLMSACSRLPLPI